jgi:hypothetical protein
MPHLLDAVVLNFLPVVRGVGFADAAVEISFANFLGRFAQPPRDSINNFLDDQHALRPSETAEGGVRSEIRLCHAPGEFHGRDIIGIIQVKHGAVGHGHGQVERPAAVGDQFNLRRQQIADVIITRLESRQKRMAFAGKHHVQIPIDPHANCALGFGRGQGCEGGESRRLCLLAAEPAAHALALHHHMVHGYREQVCDNMLHLGRVLGGRHDQNRAVLAGFSPRCLHFQIKMLLPGHVKIAFQNMRRMVQGRLHLATPDKVRLGVKTVLRDGVLNFQDWRQWFIFHHHFCGGVATGFL